MNDCVIHEFSFARQCRCAGGTAHVPKGVGRACDFWQGSLDGGRQLSNTSARNEKPPDVHRNLSAAHQQLLTSVRCGVAAVRQPAAHHSKHRPRAGSLDEGRECAAFAALDSSDRRRARRSGAKSSRIGAKRRKSLPGGAIYLTQGGGLGKTVAFAASRGAATSTCRRI